MVFNSNIFPLFNAGEPSVSESVQADTTSGPMMPAVAPRVFPRVNRTDE